MAGILNIHRFVNVHQRAVGEHEQLAELDVILGVGVNDGTGSLPSAATVGRSGKDSRATLPLPVVSSIPDRIKALSIRGVGSDDREIGGDKAAGPLQDD